MAGARALNAGRHTTAELMAVCMSRLLDGAEVIQLGLASPLGTVAGMLAARMSRGRIAVMNPAALALSRSAPPVALTSGEAVATRECLQQYAAPEWVLEVMPHLRGRVRQFVRPLQVDVRGRVNTLQVRRPDSTSWFRAAGLAGLAELASIADPFLLYLPAQSRRGFVDDVDFVVCAPLEDGPGLADERRIVMVTDLAIYELSRSGARVVSLHPGVRQEDVRKASPPGVVVDGAVETASPTSDELAVLREQVDPLGIRDLEFLRGAERRARLTDVVREERARTAARTADPRHGAPSGAARS